MTKPLHHLSHVSTDASFADDTKTRKSRQEVEAKTIGIDYIPTNMMPADGLTKPMTRQKQENFIALVNLKNTNPTIESEDKP
jgi:hypothetical protein